MAQKPSLFSISKGICGSTAKLGFLLHYFSKTVKVSEELQRIREDSTAV